MSLRDRCAEFNARLSRNAILRQGSPVEDIEGFVLTEIGRTADPSLEKTQALVLYFANDQDREEFVALVHEAKPGLMTKRFP